jgi:hypothetical protein
VKYLLNPFAGDWHPVVGSVTPLVCMVVGLIGLAWLSWRMRGIPAPRAEDEPASPGEPRRVAPDQDDATREPPAQQPDAPAANGKADASALTRA